MYQNGDNVVCVRDIDHIRKGDFGIVCCDGYEASVGVRWNNYNRNHHDCLGACDNGHGWFVHQDYVDLIPVDDMQDTTLSNLDDIL